jgi:hypothetical protein
MRYLMTALLGISMAAIPTLTGCDREVSHHDETTTDPNGTTVHKDDTVTRDANGNIIQTQTKTVDKP